MGPGDPVVGSCGSGWGSWGPWWVGDPGGPGVHVKVILGAGCTSPGPGPGVRENCKPGGRYAAGRGDETSWGLTGVMGVTCRKRPGKDIMKTCLCNIHRSFVLSFIFIFYIYPIYTYKLTTCLSIPQG